MGVFALTVALTFVFAALDAFSLVLLIPFLSTLLGGGGLPSVSGGSLIDRLLDATVGRVVDSAAEPLDAVRQIIVVILVVFAIKNLVDFLRLYLSARVEQGVTRDLRDQVYDHLLELDLAFFGRTRMGQIVSRLTTDVEQVRTLVTRNLIQVIAAFFEAFAALVAMVIISWKLTIAAFVVVPVTMGVWGPLLSRLRRGDRRVAQLAGEVNGHLQETLSGIRLVKSVAAEGFESKRFRRLTSDYFRTFVRTERLRSLAAPLTEMLAAVGTAILLWYGAWLVVEAGEISGPYFIAFLGLSMKLYRPVKVIAKFPAVVQPGLVGSERVFQFLDAPIEIRDAMGARHFEGVEREIRFEGIHFSYRDGLPVLRGIDLKVPKGSLVALVGPSGAGKTTLVDLLGRFYEPTEGRITVDGIDLREFEIASLRKGFGVVSQETVLFHDTVRANVAYGAEDVSDEAIREAARAAHADAFIGALPDGYGTVVGERGTELSGGQRQRLAIARAILRDPPILVFDEATSSLDSESERLVQAAMERLLEGRTVFVIAHRLSTVQRADLIVVIDEGRIAQRGTHTQLLEEGGLYRRLHDLQFADASPGTPA